MISVSSDWGILRLAREVPFATQPAPHSCLGRWADAKAAPTMAGKSWKEVEAASKANVKASSNSVGFFSFTEEAVTNAYPKMDGKVSSRVHS